MELIHPTVAQILMPKKAQYEQEQLNKRAVQERRDAERQHCAQKSQDFVREILLPTIAEIGAKFREISLIELSLQADEMQKTDALSSHTLVITHPGMEAVYLSFWTEPNYEDGYLFVERRNKPSIPIEGKAEKHNAATQFNLKTFKQNHLIQCVNAEIGERFANQSTRGWQPTTRG